MGRFRFGFLGRLSYLEKRVTELSLELERMERVMATLADLNAAVDAFNAELAQARTDILNEVTNLKTGPDLQPAVDAVNGATQGLKDLVAAVVPAPPAG